MKLKTISLLSKIIEDKVSEKHLSRLEEFLLSGSIFISPSEFIAIVMLLMLILEIVVLNITVAFELPLSLIVLPFFVFPGIYTYVSIKQEKKAAEVEKSAPDFLRQLSSMLKVGLSFENAMGDISKYGEGPLYDEMRRTIIEIRMGRNFDEAWRAMSKRLKSKELERIFIIVLDGRKSGSSMANVIMDVSNDLRDLLAIKRERKSSVMMSVMFLIISAVIASPFSLGMIGIYADFMQEFGKTTDLVLTAPVAGQSYLLIHSFLVGLIISVIMYGDVKRGIKFSVPLVFASYGIFYVISNFGGSLFMG